VSATSATAAGQGAALRHLMTDRVSLRAPGDSGSAWNEATHRTETTTNTPFATGVPARIKPLGTRGGVGSDALVVDDSVNVVGYVVSLPLGGDGVNQIVMDGESNTLIDVTSSADAQLVGRTLRVTGVPRGTYLTARRLLCTLND
jgi:hypothetical protein